MIAYLDSSVVLRWIFKSPGHLKSFSAWNRYLSSALLEVECFRTIERYLLEKEITVESYGAAIDQLNAFMDTLEQVSVDQKVLNAAKGQFSTAIKTLDAIHISTARLVREATGEEVAIISHDRKMNLLAKTLNFKTLETE